MLAHWWSRCSTSTWSLIYAPKLIFLSDAPTLNTRTSNIIEWCYILMRQPFFILFYCFTRITQIISYVRNLFNYCQSYKRLLIDETRFRLRHGTIINKKHPSVSKHWEHPTTIRSVKTRFATWRDVGISTVWRMAWSFISGDRTHWKENVRHKLCYKQY